MKRLMIYCVRDSRIVVATLMLLRAALSTKLLCCAPVTRRHSNRFIRQSPSPASAKQYCFIATEESATRYLSSLLALDLRTGDCYCLTGKVGSGKSAFSRAFIRSALDDDALPVPSPTYLLQQVYESMSGPPIHHFDVYRLEHASDVSRLDLPTSFGKAVSLIEWADKLQHLPTERLNIDISLVAEQTRAELVSSGISPKAQETTEDDEASAYEDRHWRKICLYPMGQVWQNRVETIVHAVMLHGANPGKLQKDKVDFNIVLTLKHSAGLCIAPE